MSTYIILTQDLVDAHTTYDTPTLAEKAITTVGQFFVAELVSAHASKEEVVVERQQIRRKNPKTPPAEDAKEISA